jgi:hypothetical protein
VPNEDSRSSEPTHFRTATAALAPFEEEIKGWFIVGKFADIVQAEQEFGHAWTGWRVIIPFQRVATVNSHGSAVDYADFNQSVKSAQSSA